MEQSLKDRIQSLKETNKTVESLNSHEYTEAQKSIEQYKNILETRNKILKHILESKSGHNERHKFWQFVPSEDYEC